MLKKIVASVLMLVMLLSLIPVSALALGYNELVDDNGFIWTQRISGWVYYAEGDSNNAKNASEYYKEVGAWPQQAFSSSGQVYTFSRYPYYNWTVSQNSTAVLLDENGVTWNNVSGGWRFLRNNVAYEYTNYEWLIGKPLPQTGTLNGQTYYFSNGVWTSYQMSTGKTLTDSNNVEWVYSYYTSTWMFMPASLFGVSWQTSDKYLNYYTKFPSVAVDESGNNMFGRVPAGRAAASAELAQLLICWITTMCSG